MLLQSLGRFLKEQIFPVENFINRKSNEEDINATKYLIDGPSLGNAVQRAMISLATRMGKKRISELSNTFILKC